MYYDFDFTVTKQTSESSKVEQFVTLAPGVIKEIVIQSSRSFAALVHFQIFKSIFQLWPSNPDGAFLLTGETIASSEEYEMEGPPWELTLVGWNEDDRFDHTLHVRFSVLPTKGPWTSALLEALFGTPKKVELK